MNQELPILYIVDPSIAVTGAFVAARNTATLLKSDARIVLVLPEGSSIAATELVDFWRVDHIPMVSLSKKLDSLLHYVPALIAGARLLKRQMKQDGARHVQLNDFYLMHGVLMRLMGFRGRIISWVRCHPARFAGPLATPMLWLAARSADRMVAVSNAIRNLLPAHALEMIYDGYDGRTRTQKLWQATDEKRFVYIGNYIMGKGQDLALKAFATIATKDLTLKLVFHGGDMGLHKNQQYRAGLEQLAAQLGLRDRVAFHDFAKDSYAVLETAYAALNFSEAESFSMTVLEACGVGVAVIATTSGGPQEIIKDGATGYLVPVGDVTAAADKMLLLARQSEKTLAMGVAAAERVRTHFAMHRMRAQLLDLWQFDCA